MEPIPSNAPANSPSKEAIAASKISGIPLMPEEKQAPQPVEQPVADAEVQAEGQTDQPATESEMEELEFDGVKFNLPKEHAPKVKDALLREADYTRKTQEVSERARVVSEQEKLLQLNREFHTSTLDDIAQVKSFDQAIAQYANVDWMSMQTDELIRTRTRYDQLKEARQNAARTLEQKWAQFNQKREEHLKGLEKAGREEAARRIQGFDDKKASALKDYAKSQGYTDSEVAMMFYRPQDIQMIWKAQQFDSLPKGTVQQRVTKAPPVLKPGASQGQQAGDKLQASFKAATGKQREAIGGEIMARKMGLKH